MCNRISWQDASAADAAKMLNICSRLIYTGVQVMSFGIKCLCAGLFKSPPKNVSKSKHARPTSWTEAKDAFAAWMIFAAAAAFLVCLLWMETAIRDRNAKQANKSSESIGGRRIFLMILVAVVAFVVWAFAMPGSPAEKQWGTDVTRYFGVAAIAVSALLVKLTQFLGLAPVH
jgi:magnesium-transporting ATPase (P-type)